MKKILVMILLLCLVSSVLIQPVSAAYGYNSDNELENECGIVFDSNGGSGDMEPLWYNGSFKLPECEFTPPEGYGFKGWQWNGEMKQPGDTVYLGGVVKAVAVWEMLPVVTITFASGEGSGSMDSVTVTKDAVYTLPQCTFTDPEGKMFDHWEVNGTIKYIGDTVTAESDITVTAVWVELPVDHICSVEKVEKVEPTETQTGKEAYYYCEGCGNAYEDEDGSKLIKDLKSWGVIEAIGVEEPEGLEVPWWIWVLGMIFTGTLSALIAILIQKKKS